METPFASQPPNTEERLLFTLSNKACWNYRETQKEMERKVCNIPNFSHVGTFMVIQVHTDCRSEFNPMCPSTQPVRVSCVGSFHRASADFTQFSLRLFKTRGDDKAEDYLPHASFYGHLYHTFLSALPRRIQSTYEPKLNLHKQQKKCVDMEKGRISYPIEK